jgi:hypothetical protein
LTSGTSVFRKFQPQRENSVVFGQLTGPKNNALPEFEDVQGRTTTEIRPFARCKLSSFLLKEQLNRKQTKLEKYGKQED